MPVGDCSAKTSPMVVSKLHLAHMVTNLHEKPLAKLLVPDPDRKWVGGHGVLFEISAQCVTGRSSKAETREEIPSL